MKKYVAALALCLSAFAQTPAPPAPPQKVLLFFSLGVEADHMLFATDALKFFAEQADRHDFRVEATSNWADLNEENLKQYQLVVWLNNFPPGAQQPAFQHYMENGGAWLGFHVAAYNDRNSRWTWFRQFLGGAIFGVNNWPPLPAKLIVDDTESPITRGLPKTWVSPTNEWYAWRPSPRLDKNVKVFLTLDPAQYPLGIKGLITDKDPDVPVVWTNTNFRMLYMNMGHGDKVFTSPVQNTLFENGILWLLRKN
ncbi:MAG TPA: ThuA domain-containing protein [Bryobacteraceae bacterium]|nr:ThuA domain-containing protein [Bryobacteraceae bacterium]